MIIVATPPSPWDVPATTQPQGATEEFSDTFSPTREQMIPHTGAVNKKEAISFSGAIYRSSLPSCAEHNTTTQRAEYPRQHTAELPRQHISTQLFQMIYCQALDAFPLCKWLTAIKPNKQASFERPFLHEKKYPRGGL